MTEELRISRPLGSVGSDVEPYRNADCEFLRIYLNKVVEGSGTYVCIDGELRKGRRCHVFLMQSVLGRSVRAEYLGRLSEPLPRLTQSAQHVLSSFTWHRAGRYSRASNQ